MPKDPLCPLGFHPQTRWPTRCKRCFREYKEHASKKEEEKKDSSYNSRNNDLELRRRTPYPEDVPRGRSILGNRDKIEESTSSNSTSKDFSTPYSSLSSEAQIRLNRLREASAERKAATTDNLTPPSTSDSRALLRRRTTDLSQILESSSGSSSSSSTVRTQAPSTSPSSNSSTSSSIPSGRNSSSTVTTFTTNSSELPTPPGRRKVFQSSASVPETETFTVRLNKSNSFNLSSDSGGSSRESSVSPVPPRRAKTPSFNEDSLSAEEDSASSTPVTKVQLKIPVPKVKVSSVGNSSSSDVTKKGANKDGDAASKSEDGKLKKVKKKRLLIQGVQEVVPSSPDESDGSSENSDNNGQSADVAFIIQVKSTRKKKKEDDDETMSMTTTTDTTETTLVDTNEFNHSPTNSWEVEELRKETDRLREKCDKLEKEKGEFLSRRVASLEAPKLQSSEYLRLQQKLNQLTSASEDMKDEKRDLEAKVRELEKELATRPTTDLMQRTVAELRSKLAGAEAQIDHLHEEKREAVQQMKDMQEEFEELQDNFREDQSEEFATVKKELDEASKNCRLLQFKLRKVEKRADQLEAEKNELEGRVDSFKNAEKIANLEEQLSKLRSDYDKLQKEKKGTAGATTGGSLSPSVLKKKSPVLTKAPSGEAVEPPISPDIDASQLLRDLQSTVERESDLREQLKFAEEEVTSLRQKINRIEDENESLLIQIKKMSAKSRPDLSVGNKSQLENQTNGEKLDASELKIQLEINDQESKILRKKVEELESSNGRLSKELQIAEDKLQSFEKGTSSVTKSKSVDEVSLLRRKVIEKEREIERLQTELLAVASKNKTKMSRAKSSDPEDAGKRQETELRVDLKKVQTELTKSKAESENQRKSLEGELAKAKLDLDVQQGKVTQLAEMNKNLVMQMEKFKQEMVAMKDHYETIQDDFVIKNSQLTSAKEDNENALQKLKKEYNTIEKELKTLRETFNTRQDTWIKEKLTMQEKLKELEQKNQKFTSIPGDKDSIRLKRLLEESSRELETTKHEMGAYKDQIIFMQRESDELRRQLEDFEKVNQVHMRSLSLTAESPKADREMKLLREKLLTGEKSHRSEVAQMKLRYEQQYALKTEEMSSLQSQLSRAKRERDTFRQMVDSAQRAISELKSRDSTHNTRRDSITGLEEAATGARAAVVSLQDRVTSLEDELSEARRETSRANTELATEKSTWEMTLGEMQQKINELEEERMLASGRNRAAGQRTRLELAWQKERDEQQRRLKEATTLARDLKTTLLEYERERDRERMENKRRIDQLKGAMEEDQEELRRKIGETQGDLLELRDAHAKLRTANEKLRRDREKLEKERDQTMKREIESRRITTEREKILEDLLSKLTASATPSSAETIRYLQTMKGMKIPEDTMNFKERKKSNFRRAASVGENDERQSQESLQSSVSAYGQEHYGSAKPRYISGHTAGSTLTLPSRGRTPVGSARNLSVDSATNNSQQINVNNQYNPRGSLYRKSLSLEQTVAMPDEQKIWKGESDAGSATSITSLEGHYSRGSSVDSRMSSVSTRSDKPKSSSLVKKVKKLVKSKSIEESPTANRVVQAGMKVAGVGSSVSSAVGSDVSLNYESDKEKESSNKKLKDKVKGIFKRSTRSPSVERKEAPTPTPPPRSSRESTPKQDGAVSTQRPLMPSAQRPLMPTKR